MKIKTFNNWKLKNKFLSVTYLNLFIILFISILASWSANLQRLAKTNIVENSTAIFYFMDGDMMHEALRGDVIKIVGIDVNNKQEFKDLKKEFKEHVKQFTSDIDEIGKLQLSPSVTSVFNHVKPPLRDYINSATEIFTIKQNNDKEKLAQLEHKTKDFYLKFKILEVAQEKVSAAMLADADKLKAESNLMDEKISWINIAIASLSFILIFMLSRYISNEIDMNIKVSNQALSEISKGNIPEHLPQKNNDEIGEMLKSINTLTTNLRNVKHFANDVGTGNFNTNIAVFDNEGELGVALSGMRDSLQRVANDDRNRNWVNTGLAQIGDILRENYADSIMFYDNIVSYIVKYLNANQGALFLLEDSNEKDVHLQLSACYAYEKKKFIEKRVNIGEGLVGQTFLEKEVNYLTDVPSEYVHITSGLGHATPTCLVLVPLKVNDDINGVLEIASFAKLENFQIEFLSKIAENISATLKSISINIKTSRLLEQTQMQAEELRAQEEEMRQNLEEMKATQEELFRKTQH